MLQAGQKIAHFEIVRKIGEGGMGEVYLAEDQKLGRLVALKTLSEDTIEGSEWLERFRREARTAAKVSHPNVMAIYDIGTVPDPDAGRDINYLVLEHIDGQPLGEYLRVNRPELSRLVRLAEKIAAGLSAAHKMNIVHRDIKADNILINEHGEPKILDFGLAKPVDPVRTEDQGERTETISQELTKVGKILGTVSYMSPEQVQGKVVDHRSDIFSFGTLLYRMCTGEAPFTGKSQVSTMAKILETMHDAPRTKNDTIPPELERIIDKCLRKDPDDRYQDTRDLVVDLRNLRRQYDSGVTGAITAATGSQIAQTKSGFLSSSWARVAGLMVLATVMAVVLIYVSLNFSSDEAEVASTSSNVLAILGFENKTGDPELAWLETGLPEILLTDLSQNQGIKIISRQRILDCFEADMKRNHTHEQCVDAAKSIGAGRLLSGTFFKVGDKIRIDARLEDIATGKIILGEKVIGTDPFVLVDSLTKKISASLNLTITGKENVTTFTSSSPEAFKQYHLGMELFWAGRWDKATDKFNEAIAIDSAFALPYMRIGMINVFEGKQGEGGKYFRLAKQHEDRLPVRERSLLDAYTTTWLEQNFSQAFTKMKTLVSNYPEDPEIRLIYALFVDGFQRDSTVSFAHLDTVLAAYPTFMWAVEQYSILLEGWGQHDRAMEYAERLVEIEPEGIVALLRLSRLYERAGRRDEAADIYKKLVDLYPDDARPLGRLLSLSIRQRDFEAARGYVEDLKRQDPEDPFTLITYYDNLANLANWEGKFMLSLEHRFSSLEQARASKDSQQVYGGLVTISAYYWRYYRGEDSALAYVEESHGMANTFSKSSYPLFLVTVDTSNSTIARPIFKSAMEEFRARVPQEFWTIASLLDDLFEARTRADTAAMIVALQGIVESQSDEQSGNVRDLGEMLVKVGRYQEGKEQLERFLSGRYESAAGWVYPLASYYVGMANEGLGNTSEAVENYREMLRFWGNPEVELDEIKDARERLARLTS
jgi:serine/threonine protein kinase/tetratricopeptide (TPR) repeat protein